jgi:aspartate aminotransferase
MLDRTIVVNGFSKSYAMTGWRLGWILADRSVLAQLIKLQQHSLTHSASFNQFAALEALRMDQKPVEDMVSEFRARRDMLVKGLNEIDGFEIEAPRGAFYVFPKYRWGIDSMAFAEQLLHQAGVAVTPGIEFGPSGERHVRISYATSRENIRTGLQRVAELAKSLAG